MFKLLAIKLIYRPQVILEIKPNEIKVLKGHVKATVIADIHDIIRETKLTSGFIFVVDKGGGLKSVRATNGISQQVLQRIRNVWFL